MSKTASVSKSVTVNAPLADVNPTFTTITTDTTAEPTVSNAVTCLIPALPANITSPTLHGTLVLAAPILVTRTVEEIAVDTAMQSIKQARA